MTSCKTPYFHKPDSVITFPWRPGSGMHFSSLLTIRGDSAVCVNDNAVIMQVKKRFMLKILNVFRLISMLRFSVNSKYFGFAFILQSKLKVTDYTSRN